MSNKIELSQEELEQKLKLAEAKGERKAWLEVHGWEGMTDEEVTWLHNYCGDANGFKERFPFHPTLEHIRELIAAEKK